MSAKPNLIQGVFGIPLRVRTDFDFSAGGVFGEPDNVTVRIVRPDRSFEDAEALIEDAVAGDVAIGITETMFPDAGDYEVQVLATWDDGTRYLPSDIGILHVGESLWATEES